MTVLVVVSSNDTVNRYTHECQQLLAQGASRLRTGRYKKKNPPVLAKIPFDRPFDT